MVLSFKDWRKDREEEEKKPSVVSSPKKMISFSDWSKDEPAEKTAPYAAAEVERAQKILEGEVVSSERRFERTGKIDPSMGGEFVRGITKLPLRFVASAKSLVDVMQGKGTEEDLKMGSYWGNIKRIGKGFDVTQGLTKQNVSALKDAAGVAAETASYFIGAKPLTSIGGATLKQLTKQEIKKKILKEATRIAKYEATAGAVGAGGFAAQEGKDLEGIITDAAIGAGLGAVLGFGIGGVGAKLKIDKDVKAIRKVEESMELRRKELEQPTPEDLAKITEEVKTTPVEKPVQTVETVTPEVEKAVAATKPIIEGDLPTSRRDKLLTAAVEKKLIDSADIESVDRVRESAAKWATDANDFIKENPDNYMDVAMGRKGHENAEAIYTAAEIKAIQEGDIARILELADSKIPSEAGRGLKKLDSSDLNSPVKIVRDIKKAREAAVQKTLGKRKTTAKAREEVVKKGKAEVKTTRMKLQEAQALLDQLVC